AGSAGTREHERGMATGLRRRGGSRHRWDDDAFVRLSEHDETHCGNSTKENDAEFPLSSYTLSTIPWVSATMMARMMTKARLPSSSAAVSRHRPASVGGGRKNSGGRSFMLTRRCGFVGTGLALSDHGT